MSNHGDFVILEMDGSNKLVVGMHPAVPDEPLSGELRLAVGGVLINTDHMIVPVGLLSSLRPKVHGVLVNIIACAVLIVFPSL